MVVLCRGDDLKPLCNDGPMRHGCCLSWSWVATWSYTYIEFVNPVGSTSDNVKSVLLLRRAVVSNLAWCLVSMCGRLGSGGYETTKVCSVVDCAMVPSGVSRYDGPMAKGVCLFVWCTCVMTATALLPYAFFRPNCPYKQGNVWFWTSFSS
jgi:hypothetical protein